MFSNTSCIYRVLGPKYLSDNTGNVISNNISVSIPYVSWDQGVVCLPTKPLSKSPSMIS